MAFRLDPAQPLSRDLRRIVDEELAAAADGLDAPPGGDRDAAVHDARKRLKKARAVVRLARYDVGRRIQRQETRALRDAARRLSGARDATVLLDTLDDLVRDPGSQLVVATATPLREALEQRRAAAAAAAPDAVREVVAEIAAVRQRAAGWPLDDDGFGSLGRGLERVATRGDAAFRHATKATDDESWHEWRKRVKDLWYALRVLEPLAPAHLAGPVADADRLSDLLGLHNDLAVLDQALGEHADAVGEEETHRLRAALDRRRSALREQALPLGRRLHAGRPQDLVRRTKAQWRTWDALERPATVV